MAHISPHCPRADRNVPRDRALGGDRTPPSSQRAALRLALAGLLTLLAGCGGGGEFTTAATPEPQALRGGPTANAPGKPVGSHGVTQDSSGDISGTDKPNVLRGTDAAETLRGFGGHDVVFAEGGNDLLDGGDGKDRMVGGPGDDTYLVSQSDDQVVERAHEGIDTVLSDVSFELPAHVENLRMPGPGTSDITLRGNDLDNQIVGAPFSYELIYGMGGDDILDGGGRHGGFLYGGDGNDRLLVSFGELQGDAGADSFVAAGRGAHTAPDVPIVIHDFNPQEGDRIEVAHVAQHHDAAALFSSGALRFDPATGTLVLDLDPSTPGTSVDQVFVLRGFAGPFDPAWITVGPQPAP